MSAHRASTQASERAGSAVRAASLAPWRERILQNTLTATAILASVAYVPAMLVAYAAGLWVLMAADTVLWGLVVSLALVDRLSFRARAIGFIGGWYVLSALLLWIVGSAGSAFAWMLSVPVLASLFFGYRGAAVGVTLVVVLSVAFWLLLPLHQSGAYLAAGGSYESQAWIACGFSMAFLSALLSLSIARLLRGLEDSLVELEVAHREVSQSLAERERLQEELLRTQKQSALGTLASGIAHDFNNILVPILMASEEARDDAPPDSPQRAHLDRVITAALRARNLIRRILDFSRSPDVQRRPTPVEPIVREAGALLRSSAPAGISIDYHLGAPGVHVMADPGELHQILMNLGTNACLAMKERGGSLVLTVERDEEAGTVRLEVEDDGPGIPPELHDRIFDPFFTTRESGTGTGLGLSIVHRLVNDMAGTIALDSAPSRGTRFTLHFPEVAPEHGTGPHGATAKPQSAKVGTSRPKTVLVVDDEELVRGMISVILNRNGYVVREAASPESALRQIHDEPDSIDLVITDQAMPYMTGLQLTRDLRQIRPDLPVVLVSGHLSEDEVKAAEALSLSGLLDKPFARRALLELVARVLGVQQPDQDENLIA